LKVRQLCTRVEFGDAVSSHVLEIAKALSEWGYDNEVYANTADEYGWQHARPDTEYPAADESADDLLIYHYSVWCSNHTLYLASPAKRILIYHNITPPQFFETYDKGVAAFCGLGRDLLPDLAGCDLALGDSEFNRLELVQAGFDADRTGVLPIFVDYEGLRQASDGRDPTAPYKGSFKVMFIGRVVPNKRIEDVLRAFYYYNRCVNSDSHLFIVGAQWVDRYTAQLQWLIDSFGLWSNVHMTGRLSDAGLAACYRGCDAFLSMSEHEGFSVPLVESMAFDLPVLAYSSTAIPYTLDGAGLAFERKDFPMVGEALESLRTDPALREAVIRGQRERLQAFSPESVRATLEGAIERVTGGGR
jgi:glycosyltransferase involved in cell wall biosynthesis